MVLLFGMWSFFQQTHVENVSHAVGSDRDRARRSTAFTAAAAATAAPALELTRTSKLSFTQLIPEAALVHSLFNGDGGCGSSEMSMNGDGGRFFFGDFFSLTSRNRSLNSVASKTRSLFVPKPMFLGDFP